MATAPGATLLFNAYLNHEKYSDNVSEIKFKTPVVIKGLVLLEGRNPPPAPHQQIIRCWALDLTAANAARFGPLYCEQSLKVIPGQKRTIRPTDGLQEFPTNHIVIRGKFQSIHLALYGQCYRATCSAGRAAGQALHPPILALPGEPTEGPAAAPPASLLLPPSRPLQQTSLLPLPTLPSRFDDALRAAARYWRAVRLSHRSIGENPPRDRFDAVFEAAEAVMAAQQGDPAPLQQLLATQHSGGGGPQNWHTVEEDVLDLATSWPELLASVRTTTAASLQAGMAGLAAALLLCSTSSLAVKFMVFHGRMREPMCGIQALWAVLKAPQLPPKASRLLLAVMELLTSTTGPLGCACLLGVCAPELLKLDRPAAEEPMPMERDEDAGMLATLDKEDDRDEEDAGMLATLGDDDESDHHQHQHHQQQHHHHQQQQQQDANGHDGSPHHDPEAAEPSMDIKDEPMSDAEQEQQQGSQGSPGSRGSLSRSSRSRSSGGRRSMSRSRSPGTPAALSPDYQQAPQAGGRSPDYVEGSQRGGSPSGSHSQGYEQQPSHSGSSQQQSLRSSQQQQQQHSSSQSGNEEEEQQHSGSQRSGSQHSASGTASGHQDGGSSQQQQHSGSDSGQRDGSGSPHRSQEADSGSGHAFGYGDEHGAVDYEGSEGDMNGHDDRQADYEDDGGGEYHGSDRQDQQQGSGSQHTGSQQQEEEERGPPQKRQRRESGEGPSPSQQTSEQLRSREESGEPCKPRVSSAGSHQQQEVKQEQQIKEEPRSRSRSGARSRSRSRLRKRRSSRSWSRSRSRSRGRGSSGRRSHRDFDFDRHNHHGIKQEQDPAEAARRRQQQMEAAARERRLWAGRQMYGALIQLARQPLAPEAASSCATVLRRLRAFLATQRLQATLGPLLDGTAQPLLLKLQDIMSAITITTAVLGGLATLVLRPAESGLIQEEGTSAAEQEQGQRVAAVAAAEGLMGPATTGALMADAAVLQQLLSGQVLELVAAAVSVLSIHTAKQEQQAAAQQQQQPEGAEPQGPDAAAQQQQQQKQLESLAALQRGLLASLRSLLAAISCSGSGWQFFSAAAPVLEGLAQAIHPGSQPLALQRGGDPPLLGSTREAILRGLQQQRGKLPEQLAASLQQQLLVAGATAHLAAQAAAGGQNCGDAINTLVAALGVESMRASMLFMLASCPSAVRCLLLHLGQLGKLLKGLSSGSDAAPELEDLEMDRGVEDDLGSPLDGSPGRGPSSSKPPGAECLLAGRLLMELVGEPHPDVVLQVLPLMPELAGRWREDLAVYSMKGLGQYGDAHTFQLQLLAGMTEAGVQVAECGTSGFAGAGGHPAPAKVVVELVLQKLLQALGDQLPRLTKVDQGSNSRNGAAEGTLPADMQKVGPRDSEDAPWAKQLPAEAGGHLMKGPHQLGKLVLQLQLVTLALQHPAELAAALQGRPVHGSSSSMLKDASQPCNLTAVALLKFMGKSGLQVLDRALRLAVAAWHSCDGDTAWLINGGGVLDWAAKTRLQVQAARLLLAASRAAAAAVKALDGRPLPGSYGLLGSLVTAHACVATSAPGLLAGTGEASLSPAAAATSAAGGASGSMYGDLLVARHALAVALAVWQKNKWVPATVPAALSVYPGRRGAAVEWEEEQAKQAAADRKAGVPATSALARGANVTLPPRAGPAELLSALLALGDVCPEEWPPAGASQRIARVNAASGASGEPATGFQPPSSTRLRANIAASLEQHMGPLKRVVEFAVASDNKLVRAALVRLCAKTSGIGGGMAPFLAAVLLEELIHIMRATAATTPAAAAAASTAGAPTLTDGRRVLEVLLPLSGKPALKAALIEHKAVSLVARYIHKLSGKVREDPSVVEVMALGFDVLLQLFNPDISLAPQLPRTERLKEDMPPLSETTTLVAALLAIVPSLGGCAEQARALILGPGAAGPPGRGKSARALGLAPGLQQTVGGRDALKQGAIKWYCSATQTPAPALGMRDEAALSAAIAWASNKLNEMAERMLSLVGGAAADPTASLGPAARHHEAAAKLCKDLAQLLVMVGPKVDPPHDPAVAPKPTITRFAEAVQASVARSPQPSDAAGLQQLEQLSPAALACDANTQEFLRHCGKRPVRTRGFSRWAASTAEEDPATAAWPAPLLPQLRPHRLARGVAAVVREEDGEQQPAQKERRGSTPGLADVVATLAPEDAPSVPVVLAPRRVGMRKGGSGRAASRHVDEFEAASAGRPPPGMPGPPPGMGGHHGPPRPDMHGMMPPGGMGGMGMRPPMMGPGMGGMPPMQMMGGMGMPGMGRMGMRGMPGGMGHMGGHMGHMMGQMRPPGGMQLPPPPGHDPRGLPGPPGSQGGGEPGGGQQLTKRAQKRLKKQLQGGGWQQQGQEQQAQRVAAGQQHARQQQQQDVGYQSGDEQLAALNSPSYSDPGDDEDAGGDVQGGEYKVTEF